MTPTYYVYDYAQLSIRELWRFTKLNPIALIGIGKIVLAKLTGRSVRSTLPTLFDNAWFIGFDDIPEDTQREIEPSVRALRAEGFTPQVAQRVMHSKAASGYGL